MLYKEELLDMIKDISDNTEVITRTLENQMLRVAAGAIPINARYYTNIIEVKEIDIHLDILREKFEILFNEKERLKNPEVDLAIKESGKSDDYLKTLSNFIISCKRQNNQDRYDLLT